MNCYKILYDCLKTKLYDHENKQNCYDTYLKCIINKPRLQKRKSLSVPLKFGVKREPFVFSSNTR